MLIIINFLLIFLIIIPYSSSEGKIFSIFYSINIFLCLFLEWIIHVYTGKERFSGTDSNIFIRLFNTKYGYTPEYKLTHENSIIPNNRIFLKNLFESGERDRFRIFTDQIGSVEKIYVRYISIISFFLEF